MAIQIKKLTDIALVNITSAIQASERITFSSVLAHPNAMDEDEISNATSPTYGPNERYSSDFASISRDGNNIRAVVQFNAEEGTVGKEYKTFFLVASYEGVPHCFAGMTTGSDDGIYLPGEGDAVSPVYVEFHISLTSGAETIFIPSSAATPSFKDLERMVTCHSAFDDTSGEDQWIYGNKSFGGDVYIGSNLDVEGDTSLSNTNIVNSLVVEGDTKLENTKIDGELQVNENIITKMDLNVKRDLNVDGDVSLGGNTTLSDASLEGEFDINGTVSITGSFYVVDEQSTMTIYGESIFHNTVEVRSDFEANSVTCTSFKGSSISLAFGGSFGRSVSFNEVSGATEAPFAIIRPNADYTIDLGDKNHCYNKVWTKYIKAFGEIEGKLNGNVEGNLTGTASKAKADENGNVIISSYGKTLDTNADGKRISLKSLDGTGLSDFDPKWIIVSILRGASYGSSTYGGIGSIGLFIATFSTASSEYSPGTTVSGSGLYRVRLRFTGSDLHIGSYTSGTSAGLTGTWVLLNHVISGASDTDYAYKAPGLFLRIS